MAPTVLKDKLPLTSTCHHYDDLSEVPWDLQKYWHQRYSIFQHYDYDIRLTDDAWFGVTPEPVAAQIAWDMSPRTPANDTLIDIFGGAGGNSIAFALSGKWQRVIAVEKDAATLACAQHNAEVYGVEDGAIVWVHGDCFEFLSQLKAGGDELDPAVRCEGDDLAETTTIFASPPWGGVSYRDHDVFDLGQMHPYTLADLYEACRPMEHVLFLPRTSDIRQIARLAPEGKKIDVVQYCMEGASKAMVAFMPPLTAANSP
ncbi:RNA cap guanine-N2 methyltransferase-domain-containing protein [Lasiosphaeris hirsuta]|uniref:Trimethylguanosine synthase n=1 Tax=Lasiosphaeris hirsuta TaxID=260670 RepID=A0AA40BC75_9PEZI|nr:RNA cap guanine-N2 methyltransferase-domain-containing protein [Lasiosphaeris hirsuta]